MASDGLASFHDHFQGLVDPRVARTRKHPLINVVFIAVCGVLSVKRGLKRGLDRKGRSVVLMLDETIVTETPPLYSAYGHAGVQVRVPITGNRAKRILHGTINIKSGDVALLITEEWVNETHQAFLTKVRSHWRGWNSVLFQVRASQHKSPSSRALAEGLGIEVRLLPKATPELNARWIICGGTPRGRRSGTDRPSPSRTPPCPSANTSST